MITGVVYWGAALLFPPLIAVLVSVAAGLVVTGGLHEDGFADACDGLGGVRPRERVLEIMRDSRIGSYGTLALILVLGLRVQALAQVAGQGSAIWGLIAIEAASRAGLPLVLRVLPAARGDGLGFGAAKVSWTRVIIALAVGIASLALLGGLLLGVGQALLAGYLPNNNVLSTGLRPALPFVAWRAASLSATSAFLAPSR